MPLAKLGDNVTLHYTGTFTDKTVFDSTLDRDPIEITLGAQHIIRGLEQAIIDMYVGEKKQISIPMDEAYGPRSEEGVFTLPKEQTREVTEKELTEFKVEKGQPWIQAFLKSNEYTLLDNEGGGDCLFATIRDALLSLGKDITVAELRNKLANEVTEEVYENYKEKYTLFSKSVKTDEIELKRLSKINNELRDRLKNTKDRDEQLKIIGEAKTIADTFKSLKKDVAISKEMLQELNG